MMKRQGKRSPETARTSAIIERGGMPRWLGGLVVGFGVTAVAITGAQQLGIGNKLTSNGQMTIEAAPDNVPTTKLPKAGPPEIPSIEEQRRILEQYEANNKRLTERLEAQNQVAELVNYRLACGEGQDVFWGRVSIYDTKSRQELANFTNPIVATPSSMGFDYSNTTEPYAVVGVVPGKPTASAVSPYQKITLDAYLVQDKDTLAIFTDYEGNVATYPEMDIRTLDIADSYIRNVAPIARYDMSGDIFSLQFAGDGTGIGIMNPVTHAAA